MVASLVVVVVAVVVVVLDAGAGSPDLIVDAIAAGAGSVLVDSAAAGWVTLLESPAVFSVVAVGAGSPVTRALAFSTTCLALDVVVARGFEAERLAAGAGSSFGAGRLRSSTGMLAGRLEFSEKRLRMSSWCALF